MKRRESFLDALRIIGIFLVMYVHTGENLMYAWMGKSGLEFWVGLFLNQLSISGTSLFFFISGYLLLDKDESVGWVLRHRLLRYIVLLLFFGFGQQLYDFAKYNSWQNASFSAMCNRVYSTNVIGQYWFLYAYVAFIISLPVLRILAKNISRKTAIYYAAVFLVIEVISILPETLFKLDGLALDLPLLKNIVFLPLMGYLVKHIFTEDIKKKSIRLGIYVLGAAALAFSVCYVAHYYGAGRAAYSCDGLYMVTAFSVFVFVKQLTEKRDTPGKESKALSICGRGVLLIYLAEVQLKDATFWIYTVTKPYITWLPAGLLWLGASFLLGTCIATVLRFIPGVKKLI